MKIRIQTPLGEIELYSRRLPDGHTSWSRVPNFSKRVASEKQQDHITRFREAVDYARNATQTMPIYAELAAKTAMKTAYNLAVSDWFHPPEIVEVDLTGWMGQAGQVIRVLAMDDVQVKQVRVAITDEDGAVLEEGPAMAGLYGWWIYRTTVSASGHARVCAAAEDLPGHVTEKVMPLPSPPQMRR